MIPHQVEYLFRHEYGKLVAILVRRFSIDYIEAIEDSVQFSMMQAVEFWRKNGAPKSPVAWLYQVANRKLISEIRTKHRREQLLNEQYILEESEIANEDEITLSSDMNDSMLRMLFLACHAQLPIESQLVFTLKSLCGFTIKEIASRLFLSEDNAYKRFSRARKTLRTLNIDLNELKSEDLQLRLPAVYRVLYLIFTEGYLSSHTDNAIRLDLCKEAIWLVELLSDSSLANKPETYALLALMYFHLARIDARQDSSGMLVLLEHQDRSQWDQQHILIAMGYLEKSADGDIISRYHIEAGIAAEHCLSPSFEQTSWEKIIKAYQLLEQVSPSPLHILNRAIATAQLIGAKAGLEVLNIANIPAWLARSYHWYAVVADLHYQCNEIDAANKFAGLAIQQAPTKHIKLLLEKRFHLYQ